MMHEGPGLHRSHAFLNRLCRRAKALHVPALALYRAALAREIDLVSLIDPEQPWPAIPIALARRPIVALVSDDPHGRPAWGPYLWRSAPSMRAWATGAIIHADCGRFQKPYYAAVDGAKATGRALLIETSSGLAERWAEFLDMPCVIVTPTDGGVHPVTERAA